MSKWAKTVGAMLLLAGVSEIALAKPVAIKVLCEVYPDSKYCLNDRKPTCQVCHTSPPGTNSYGTCVAQRISGEFEAEITDAMIGLHDADCDGDGLSNIEEILVGSPPGKKNIPKEEEEWTCEQRNAASHWNVCGYDYEFAYRRMMIDFCGHSADFASVQQLKKLSDEGKRQVMHDQLDVCFQSEYWRGPGGVVWQIAHPKIQPLQTLKSGENRGSIPLGDYDDDYNLFAFYHLDNRDVRGVLTAQHFVERSVGAPSVYSSVDEVMLHPNAGGVVSAIADVFEGTQQWVPNDKRAGMLTTLWLANSLTMFTSIPRTTAAHAMRHYLGLDIARSEGLVEPEDPNFVLVDHDSKGVTASDCAYCHKALDAASYPFTSYNGLSFNIPTNSGINIEAIFDPEDDNADTNIPDFLPQRLVERFLARSKFLVPGMYKVKRMDVLAEVNADTEPTLVNTPEAGFLLGERVENLLEWAVVASNSDEFAKKTSADYWQMFLGGDPVRQHHEEFEKLWRDFKGGSHAYQVQSMLHKLIETEAYGAP